MDPFIEASDLWGDFHDKLIGDLERELSERVPKRYVVRLNARSYITVDDNEQGDFAMLPDIGVKRRKGRKTKPKPRSSRSSSGTTAMLEQSVVMLAPLEVEQREKFIEIYDIRSERHLVTGIEVLSPSNKRFGTAGWDEYGLKRRAFLAGAASFVEIDLLRGGGRMPMREPWPDSPYYVSRSTTPKLRAVMSGRRTRCNRCREFRFRLRKRMPTSRSTCNRWLTRSMNEPDMPSMSIIEERRSDRIVEG